MNARFVFPLALLVLAVAGCGGEDSERMDLSGNVTFDGKPLPYGQIRFTPDSNKGHSGPQGYAEIKDGKYNTETAGQGVFPGPHIVTITGFEEKPPVVEDETSPEAQNAPGPIFANYAIEQDLQDPGQDFEVPAEAKGASSRQRPRRPAANEP